MTVRQINRLFKHWSKFPPVRTLVAAAVGFEPKTTETDDKKYMTADDMKALMAATGGRVPGMS